MRGTSSYNLFSYSNISLLVNLSSMAVGTTLGWTAPVNPKLNDKLLTDTPLSAVPTEDESSWIGSLVALGAVIGKQNQSTSVTF